MDSVRYRVLLIGRALYLGTLWGAVLGGVTLTLWCLAFVWKGGLTGMVCLVVACPVGGGVGAAIGSVAGLALALSGRRVIGQLYRARLVTGGAAVAVPLAVALQLHRPRPSVDYLMAAGVAAVAVVAAVLLTPRILNGPPPPGIVYGPPAPMPPVRKPRTPAPRTAGEHCERPEWLRTDLGAPEPSFRRRLIIGRGLGWGVISGTALGAVAWTVLCVEVGELRPMAFLAFPALLGAVLGGCLGLAAGLALALGGERVVRPMYRARLVAGGVVTAIPVAIVHVALPRTPWTYAYLLSPINLTLVAGLTAALLAPYIVLGSPER